MRNSYKSSLSLTTHQNNHSDKKKKKKKKDKTKHHQVDRVNAKEFRLPSPRWAT